MLLKKKKRRKTNIIFFVQSFLGFLLCSFTHSQSRGPLPSVAHEIYFVARLWGDIKNPGFWTRVEVKYFSSENNHIVLESNHRSCKLTKAKKEKKKRKGKEVDKEGEEKEGGRG